MTPGGPVRRRPPHGPSPHPHRGVSLLSTCASVGCAQHYLAKPPGPVGSVQAGRRTASTEQALSPVSPSTASQLAMLGGSQLWPRAGGAHTYAHSKQSRWGLRTATCICRSTYSEYCVRSGEGERP